MQKLSEPKQRGSQKAKCRIVPSRTWPVPPPGDQSFARWPVCKFSSAHRKLPPTRTPCGNQRGFYQVQAFQQLKNRRNHVIQNNTFWRCNFYKYALIWVVCPIRTMHYKLPNAAGTKIKCLEGVGKAFRSPPLDKGIRVAKRLKNFLLRGINHPCTYNFPIGCIRYNFTLLAHAWCF
jgi:hypothetical protein